MSNLTSVSVTAGIPTAGTGTVSTLDGIIDATNGPVAIKAASAAPLASDPALVVAISPNGINVNLSPAGTTQVGAPTVNVNQYATHQEVAAGHTGTGLGSPGAIGDYLSHVVVYPAIAACGVVTILDGAATVGTFAGGGVTPLPTLAPFTIEVGAYCTGAGWKITTGANVAVSAVGRFS